MTDSFFKQAHTAFEAGDYQSAVEIYEQAILQRPELAGFYRFNLEHMRGKIEKIPDAERRAPESLSPDRHIPKNGYLFIIGAMKCGTTSLFEYLRAHPAICAAKLKEPDYFTTITRVLLESYENLWNFDANRHRYAMEASTGYTKYPMVSGVAQRIYEYGIRPKFLYIVRNPFDRIRSHFEHNIAYNGSRETDSMLNPHRIASSNYAMQLDQYTRFFPVDDILILDFDDLVNCPDDLLFRTHDFLHLPRSKYPGNYKKFNLSKKNVNKIIGRQFTSEDRVHIHTQLADGMKRFQQAYGFDVGKWGFDVK